jgi:hypothetical protein
VVADFCGALEILAAVQTDTTAVVEIGGLRQALRECRPEIIVQLSVWWPKALFGVFVVWVVLQLVIHGAVSLKGLSVGYKVESCHKLKVKDFEISNCLKLTKP